MTSENARIPVLAVAAIGFCCVGLVTAFIGLRDVIGAGSTAKLWLVLFVAAGIAALVLLRTAREGRGRVRLGVGWAVLGGLVIGVAIDRTPSPEPGVPIGSGWAVLVAGGAGVLVGGVLLATSPLFRASTNWLVSWLVVVAVCAIEVGGYAGAVAWTDRRNVQLTVAEAAPPQARESVVDGRVQWSSIVQGALEGQPAASAGGVLTALPNGLRMLDPATGAVRWTYLRADATEVFEPVASSDGAYVAGVAVGASLNPKPADEPSSRLLVLDAVTGRVITDSVLDRLVQGRLAAVDGTDAYFAGSPDGLRTVQVSAVKITGPRVGQQDWAYVPKDGCAINAISALNTEVAVSTTCGTVAMLNPDGTQRWVFHSPAGDAQIWPLAGSPAGTVQAVTQPGPAADPPGEGVSAPSGVVSLDARTGAVRWQDGNLPAAPFAPDSQDAATATMSTFWAGGTAALAYNLPQTRAVWLVGYHHTGAPKSWSALVYSIAPGVTVGNHVQATSDGRILVPGQNIGSANDRNAHPTVTVINARNGSVGPGIAIDGPSGIAGSVGFASPPSVLSTPGGVVLAIVGARQEGDTGLPKVLLVGLH